MKDELIAWMEENAPDRIVELYKLRQEDSYGQIEQLQAENVLLRGALENTELFAKYIETLGRTDCEIYKHELKGSADLSISRIEQALTSAPESAKISAVLDAAKKHYRVHKKHLDQFTSGTIEDYFDGIHEQRIYEVVRAMEE